MSKKVTVIDYGASNLCSVEKAFKYIGADVSVTSDVSKVMDAERLVLPGNGAFKDAMRALHDLGLDDAIRGFIGGGRPFFGICVGMQLLFDKSFEFGETNGFGYIKGDVKRFPEEFKSKGLKIPHMGWNTVKFIKKHQIFDSIENNSYFYFVHSYFADTQSQESAGVSDYGFEFTAAIVKDNIVGAQFHPEKSQKAGLRLLENFCNI